MRIIVAGSRDLKDVEAVDRALERTAFLPIDLILTGGCRGVDRRAEQWARTHGVPFEVYLADWKTYGKAAGPLRNRQMAGRADALILIWNGRSRGSLDMLNAARAWRLGIEERVVE